MVNNKNDSFYIHYYKTDNNITSTNLRFKKNPTHENFLRIFDVVEPYMLRGGNNPDNIGKGEVMMTDMKDVAMVLKGYKPMCLISQKSWYPFIFTMNFKVIVIHNQYIIWINDMYTEKARHFETYLKNPNKDKSPYHG